MAGATKALQIRRLSSGVLITNYYCTSRCAHCLYCSLNQASTVCLSWPVRRALRPPGVISPSAISAWISGVIWSWTGGSPFRNWPPGVFMRISDIKQSLKEVPSRSSLPLDGAGPGWGYRQLLSALSNTRRPQRQTEGAQII
jgi:hypothetical protein